MSTAWPTIQAQAEKIGVAFDPWQSSIGKLLLAKRSDGLYACGIGGAVISIPRQVGKTYTIGWIIFCLCLVYPKLTIVWTAHRSRTSDETFASMKSMAAKPSVAPFIASSRAANGQQAIEFVNGSRILFGAREHGFGRGFAMVSVIVFDEAQILSEAAIEDMLPAANAAPNGLVIYMGTPPRPKDPGEHFTSKRREALAGDEDTLYVEFSASPKVDVDTWKPGSVDWKAIAEANPSYPHRTSRAAIMRLRKNLEADAFRREVLGVWDPETTDASPLPIDEWMRLETAETAPVDAPLSFAVRFSVDGSHVALAAACKLDGARTLTDGIRLQEAGEGTAFLVDFLTDPKRLKRTAQIVVEGKAGAAYLVDQLREAGVPARVIWTPRADQVIAAHAMMLAAFKDQTLVHRGGNELARQVRLARRRKIGTLGGFGWQAPPGDTCALLDALTLAHWASKTSKRRAGRKQEALS